MEQQTSRRPVEISVFTTSFQVPLDDSVGDRLDEAPVVLFTGAGASVPLGMPAMKEFRKQLSERLPGSLMIQWDSVVELAAAYYEVDSDDVDIEQVLTFVERSLYTYSDLVMIWTKAEEREDSPTVRELENFRDLLLQLRICILDEICATYRGPDPAEVLRCYDPLFKMLTATTGQLSTNVFTTNYDLTFESLAEGSPEKYEVFDGFQINEVGQEIWKGKYIAISEAEHSITLWKLHGSTSWQGDETKRELTKAPPSTYIQDEKTTGIIYPTKSKAKTQELFSRPFNQAYGRLASLFDQPGAVGILLVIGYGFGDKEIRCDIENGLVLEDRAKLIVVDPDATICKLKRLFPKVATNRITVIDSYFGQEDTIETIRSAVEGLLNQENLGKVKISLARGYSSTNT